MTSTVARGDTLTVSRGGTLRIQLLTPGVDADAGVPIGSEYLEIYKIAAIAGLAARDSPISGLAARDTAMLGDRQRPEDQ